MADQRVGARANVRKEENRETEKTKEVRPALAGQMRKSGDPCLLEAKWEGRRRSCEVVVRRQINSSHDLL